MLGSKLLVLLLLLVVLLLLLLLAPSTPAALLMCCSSSRLLHLESTPCNSCGSRLGRPKRPCRCTTQHQTGANYQTFKTTMR
jgi:hypothetical protein